MTKTNPLLKLIKEGDLVLMEISGFTSVAKQICRLKNIKFQPANEEYNFDWLDFEVDVLYTSIRMHPTLLNQCIGNCQAIKEIIPEGILEIVAKNYNVWKADEYMLSDAELEATRQRVTNDMENLIR